MKLRFKLIAVIFFLLFLAVVPIQAITSAWNYLVNSLDLAAAYSSFESYHIYIVALLLLILLAYLRARKLIGSPRIGYPALSIVIMLTAALYQNPLNIYETVIVQVVALAVSIAIFVTTVRIAVHRALFSTLSAISIVLAVAIPIYYLVLFGFFIFVFAVMAYPKTRASTPQVQPKKKRSPPAQQQTPENTQEQPKTQSRSKKKPAAKIEVPPDLDVVPPNVQWPAQSDYSRAMQNLTFSISKDYPDVLQSVVIPNPYVNIPGNVVYSSGNYGTIFKLQNGGEAHAMKCFTKSKPDLAKRYYIISQTLENLNDGNTFAKFRYLPKTIRTLKNPAVYFPTLLMQWVDGINLNTYITKNLKTPRKISDLARKFLNVMIQVQSYGIAHGDISGDNIMVTPSADLILVDYDGMYVPGLKGMSAPENGHDHFQHPGRTINTYGERLDNFSVLVTFLSMVAVGQSPGLWDAYNMGDQDSLLFRKKDFTDPKNSEVIAQLMKAGGKTKKLTSLLVDALSHEPMWEGIDPSAIAKIQK